MSATWIHQDCRIPSVDDTPKPMERCEGCLTRPSTHKRLVRQYGCEDTLWFCDECDPDYDPDDDKGDGDG